MSEPIVTKRCCKCKEIKPFSEFHKNRTTKDGLSLACKICNKTDARKYRRSSEGIAYQKAYGKTARGREVRNNANNKYRQTEKGKKGHSQRTQVHNLKYPARIKARSAVRINIRDGKLPRPDTLQCKYCPQQAKEYHHPSYKPEHWLHVEPVCKGCHYKLCPQNSYPITSIVTVALADVAPPPVST